MQTYNSTMILIMDMMSLLFKQKEFTAPSTIEKE